MSSTTTTPHPTKAYKILTRPQYTHFHSTSHFAGSPLDLKDGYIHLSSTATALETYTKYFAATASTDDPVVLEIDFARLGEGSSVKWEESRGGQLFPHVYGGLEWAAVTRKWEGGEVGEELFVRLLKAEQEGQGM